MGRKIIPVDNVELTSYNKCIIVGDGPPIDAPILQKNTKLINKNLVTVSGVISSVGILGAFICIGFNVTHREAT